MACRLAATAALLLMTVSSCVPVNADGDSNLLPQQPRGWSDDPTVGYGDDDVVPPPAVSTDSMELPQAPAPDAVVDSDPPAIGPSSEDAEVPQADVPDSMLDLTAGIPVADDGPEAAVPEPLIALQPAASPIDAPADEGQLRLVSRVDINGFVTGAVQIFHDGAYGAVCRANFGPADAQVACRQLGYNTGTALPLALELFIDEDNRPQLEEVVAPFVLQNLNCTGSEASLLDCPGVTGGMDYDDTFESYDTQPFIPDPTLCDPLWPNYAFVACGTTTGPERGDLRLSGGRASESGNAQYGRLEIFDAGGWGSTCGFNPRRSRGGSTSAVQDPRKDAAITVACRQLGFVAGEMTQLAVNQSDVELRRIPIFFELAGAGCTGEESSLSECDGPELGVIPRQCGVRAVISVVCFSNLDPETEGSLRLAAGESGDEFEYGRLEIFVRGVWSTICDTESITPDSAQLACTLLGYDGGAALAFPVTDAQVSASDIDVPTGLVSTLPVGLASVDCVGNETSLLQCTSSRIDAEECGGPAGNFTDATILACANSAGDCLSPPPTEGSLRLRGGFGSPCDPIYTGFVEIFHLNEWGAICDRFGGFGVADVVCRQLGFPHGDTVNPSTNPPDPEPGQFGSGARTEEAEEPQERFWLSDASCAGPEGRLLDCELSDGFISNNAGCDFQPIRLTVACRAFAVSDALEDVTTPGAEQGDVRLVDNSTVDNWQIGRLEIFFEGSWGQVCADTFDGPDALVACRSMGFSTGAVGPSTFGFTSDFSPPPNRLIYPEVALSLPGCTGSEASLLDCPGDERTGLFSGNGCFDEDNPGLMLACVQEAQPGEEGALRLIDGGADGDGPSGILEIFHEGAWGTFCDAFDYEEGLTETAAIVACRQLGFTGDRAAFRTIASVPDSVTLRPAWLTALPCATVEDTVTDCGQLAFGDTGLCSMMTTQQLLCSNGSDPSLLEPRLVGGAADSNGVWAYGRLEVYDGGFFSSLSETSQVPEQLGRRGVEVACRTLGFSSGVQLLSGLGSGLPGLDGTVETLGEIRCIGDEATFEDCDLVSDYNRGSSTPGEEFGDTAIAVLCHTPSGCTEMSAEPSQGDVRLINLGGMNFTTQTCDDVHFGGVEIFNDGMWGRVCANSPVTFNVEAKVICRQLGFPFGSLIDVNEVSSGSETFIGEDYVEYNEPGELVWATDIECTGKEERIDECFFPEAFGANLGDYYGGYDYGNSGPPPPAPPGLPRASCRRRDADLLAVACRRFEIEGSDAIRRL